MSDPWEHTIPYENNPVHKVSNINITVKSPKDLEFYLYCLMGYSMSNVSIFVCCYSIL